MGYNLKSSLKKNPSPVSGKSTRSIPGKHVTWSKNVTLGNSSSSSSLSSPLLDSDDISPLGDLDEEEDELGGDPIEEESQDEDAPEDNSQEEALSEEEQSVSEAIESGELTDPDKDLLGEDDDEDKGLTDLDKGLLGEDEEEDHDAGDNELDAENSGRVQDEHSEDAAEDYDVDLNKAIHESFRRPEPAKSPSPGSDVSKRSSSSSPSDPGSPSPRSPVTPYDGEEPPHGFYNPNVMCYRNSSVQVLLHIDEMRQLFLAHDANVCPVKKCLACALHNLITEYWRPANGRRKVHDQLMKKLFNDARSLGRYWKQWASASSQEDAHEFLFLGLLAQICREDAT